MIKGIYACQIKKQTKAFYVFYNTMTKLYLKLTLNIILYRFSFVICLYKNIVVKKIKNIAEKFCLSGQINEKFLSAKYKR